MSLKNASKRMSDRREKKKAHQLGNEMSENRLSFVSEASSENSSQLIEEKKISSGKFFNLIRILFGILLIIVLVLIIVFLREKSSTDSMETSLLIDRLSTSKLKEMKENSIDIIFDFQEKSAQLNCSHLKRDRLKRLENSLIHEALCGNQNHHLIKINQTNQEKITNDDSIDRFIHFNFSIFQEKYFYRYYLSIFYALSTFPMHFNESELVSISIISNGSTKDNLHLCLNPKQTSFFSQRILFLLYGTNLDSILLQGKTICYFSSKINSIEEYIEQLQLNLISAKYFRFDTSSNR